MDRILTSYLLTFLINTNTSETTSSNGLAERMTCYLAENVLFQTSCEYSIHLTYQLMWELPFKASYCVYKVLVLFFVLGTRLDALKHLKCNESCV